MGVAYGWDEHVHYSAAKAGVVGLVRGLAVELAQRAACASTASRPATSAPRSCSREEHSLGPEGAEAAAPSFRWAGSASPKRSPTSSLFLASPAARYMTGQVVVVDGGLLVGRY